VAGEDADEYVVLELLTALHDKSLLMVDRDTQAQPRYRMLETVRQYAEERLNEARESDEVRNRHLMHYVEFCEQASPEMVGANQVVWYARLRDEQENLVAAHAWCAHAPRGSALALRLAGASWRYWLYSAQPDRGYRLAAAAVELAGAEIDSVAGCQTLHGMYWHAFRMGRYADARSLAERCLAVARRIGEPGLLSDGLRAVACSLNTQGEFSKAIGYYEEARDYARAAGDAVRFQLVMGCIAECHRGAGNLATAESLYRESLNRTSARDNARGRANALTNLAYVLIATDRRPEARAALVEARSIARHLGHKGLIECAMDVAAALASSLDEHVTTARLHGAMLRQMEEAGTCQEPVDEASIAPWIARSRAALGDARFEAAQAEGGALTYAAAVAELDRWLANTESLGT